jgi:hypothetical protein
MVKVKIFLLAIIICVGGNVHAQYNKKFYELRKSNMFCEGSIIPIGLLVPCVHKVPQKYIEAQLPFREKSFIYFFVCVNPSGKAQEIHFIEAVKHEGNNVVKYDSLEFEEFLKIQSFVDYIDKVDFLPARGGMKTYSCKMVLAFEAKQSRNKYGKQKPFYNRRFALQEPICK